MARVARARRRGARRRRDENLELLRRRVAELEAELAASSAEPPRPDAEHGRTRPIGALVAGSPPRCASASRCAASCRAWAFARSSTGSRRKWRSRAGCATMPRGVTIEVQGHAPVIELLARRVRDEAPSCRASTASMSAHVPRGRRRRLCHPRQRRRPRVHRDRPRQRRLRRLPRRAVRSGRPPVSIRLHQLHQLRAALHDHPRPPVRPRAHQHGGLRAVPRLPCRIPRPGPPALPCGTQRLPRLRPAARPARCRGARGARRRSGGRGGAGSRPRRNRGGQGPGRLPPRLRRARRGCRRAAARAQEPGGEAVRDHGRQRGVGGALGGNQRAERARSRRRSGRSCCCASARRPITRRAVSRRDSPGWARCSRTRRCSICCFTRRPDVRAGRGWLATQQASRW